MRRTVVLFAFFFLSLEFLQNVSLINFGNFCYETIRKMSNGRFEQKRLVPFTGDFAVLKEYLDAKESTFWTIVQLLVSFLRGFAQAVFANNPLSGLLIIVTLAATAPEVLPLTAGTALLGLLLSVLIGEPPEKVDNGLTVYNPLLIGVVSYAFVPTIYGDFDAFCILVIIVGVIFSVYLTRSLGSYKFPCATWPFNIAEIMILLVLSSQGYNKSFHELFKVDLENATKELMLEYGNFTFGNETDEINWGMIFRGVVTSASQVFAVDDVAVGSIVYLGILIYSPTMAGFSFLGALIGSLTGLGLAASLVEIYSGLWSLNNFLAGAAFGGIYFQTDNAQGFVKAIVAIIFTTIVQYCLQIIFGETFFPVLTLPFVITSLLFCGLQNISSTTDSLKEMKTHLRNGNYGSIEDQRGFRSDTSVGFIDEPEITTEHLKIREYGKSMPT